jgi:hypothetical protein
VLQKSDHSQLDCAKNAHEVGLCFLASHYQRKLPCRNRGRAAAELGCASPARPGSSARGSSGSSSRGATPSTLPCGTQVRACRELVSSCDPLSFRVGRLVKALESNLRPHQDICTVTTDAFGFDCWAQVTRRRRGCCGGSSPARRTGCYFSRPTSSSPPPLRQRSLGASSSSSSPHRTASNPPAPRCAV